MKLLIPIFLRALSLHAEDVPKPTVEQLQAELAQQKQDNAALAQQLQAWIQRHDRMGGALGGCIGPIPQAPQPQGPLIRPPVVRPGKPK